MFGWNETAWFAMCAGVALKSTAVLAAAWIIALLMRARSAAARHLVWTAALAAVVALPFLSVSLPALRVPAAAAFLPGTTPVVFQANASTSWDAASRAASPPSAGALEHPTVWQPSWKLLSMLLWALGAAAIFMRTLVAGAAIRRARRSAEPFFDRDLCDALAQILGIRHPVDVLEANAGSMPMTCGFLRSAILIPADSAQWGEERRRLVLLHELAHVRRGDVTTHFVARMALTFYWWNPLAWAAWRG